jgi:hypothetical protein
MPGSAASRASVPMTSSASTPSIDQQRPAQCTDALVQRRDLLRQVVGHRRAVRLVVGIPVVAEGLALGVEDTGAIVRLEVAIQPA